ncbi:MAG: hypothetical protein FGM18_01330 [Burkholderiaceae bacterium]|nr:hypothetical protein [Burkholderiaceae bacterium]
MLSAAWLLAAVELNGALISKGAQVQLTEKDCKVEVAVMAKSISAEHLKAHQHAGIWSIPSRHCALDEAEGLLRIRLPQQALASRELVLGAASGTMSVALLHDPTLLSRQPEFMSQPTARTIPSAAIDLFVGSDLRGLGTVIANGPWSVSALHQQAGASSPLRRASGEYFFADGAQLRAGDFRTDFGAEQRFGEFRGMLATNRAAPLRGEGKAEAQLAIQNPSRVQFFDRNGAAVFSSEILMPGNYQIQGYGASTIPGFLEARLVDINGVAQTVALPWSADRRLLSANQIEWEAFAGRPRDLAGGIHTPPLISARLRLGLHQLFTAGLHLEQHNTNHRRMLELNSRAIPSLLTTAAVGQSCIDQNCSTNWLAEARATLGRGLTGIAAINTITAIVPTSVSQRSAQLSVSGALSPIMTGAIHMTASDGGTGTLQHATTLATNLRLSGYSSLQLQARRQLLANDTASWGGFIGLTIALAKHNTTISSALNLRPASDATNRSPELTFGANLSTPGLYGPQINAAQTTGSMSRTDGFARYASPYGDGSLRADSISQKLSWSGSTRLWITSERILFAPAGEDNLVIQHIGQSAVGVQHAGRDRQVSDAQGLAVFKKAPPWTETVYAIDPRSLPFGASLAAHRVRIPLATNRAYLVDYRNLWSQAQHWKIARPDLLDLPETILAQDRHQRRVFVAADGYVDLQSADALPLTVINRRGESLRCMPEMPASGALKAAGETALDCAVQLAL